MPRRIASAFRAALDALQPAFAREPAGRRWVYAPYDQLTDRVGPLSEAPPETLGLVVVECPGKAARRPYHKQKLALILSNLRHFALEQAARGVLVRHVVTPHCYRDGLAAVIAEVGPLTMMEPAERELRAELAPLVADGRLHVVPHAGWLSEPSDFRAASKTGAPPWKMEPFYQHLRKKTGLLMGPDGKPLGGQFNFDADNRRPWRPQRGDPPPPLPPRFEPDAITREVGELVLGLFAHHPGHLDLTTLPATQADADALWAWAKAHCLPYFGPFEDAMHAAPRLLSGESATTGLFHTRIAPLLNLHRLLPRDVVSDVAALDLDLPSKEGFIRQILGWREYVRHVHAATDGFRDLPGTPVAATPGDGGFAAWRASRGLPALPVPLPDPTVDGGAAPSALGAEAPVPPAFWGTPSGLRCLDLVVEDVWREGWSHHITRLMVLANIATSLHISPRALTDWFWVAYIDAFDWVVEPNVLGMGTYGAGGVMTTKPYVSGGAYIHRMSNYCGGCAFDPAKNCPVTALYWDFMARHEALFRANHRTSGAIAGLTRRTPEQRDRDHAVAETVRARLGAGQAVTPRDVG